MTQGEFLVIVRTVGAGSTESSINNMPGCQASSAEGYKEPVMQASEGKKTNCKKNRGSSEKQKDFAFLMNASSPAKAGSREAHRYYQHNRFESMICHKSQANQRQQCN